MIDWHKSMTQTFEYYTVDPDTWKDVRQLNTVTSCTVEYDADSDGIISATLEVDEDLGECYVRAYLAAQQDGINYRFPLGCFLVQYTGTSNDGTHDTVSLECMSPLTEAKEKYPALGYYVAEGADVMNTAYRLMGEAVRMPVVKPVSAGTIQDDFVAETSDTWLSFNSDLIATAGYHFGLDEMSRLLFEPDQDLSAMRPSYEYAEDEYSLLYPDYSWEKDLYSIPNVVEVVYTGSTRTLTGRAVNDDPNSPTSTVARGREIPKRITDATFAGEPTANMIQEYAENQLKALSTLTVTYSYKHGYNDTHIGQCVLIKGVRAKIVSQSIECTEGCPVDEVAEAVVKYWE